MSEKIRANHEEESYPKAEEIRLAIADMKRKIQEAEEESELKMRVKEFFTYLDTVEESEEGREFHPLQFTCCRSTMTPKVEACLERMKELACK